MAPRHNPPMNLGSRDFAHSLARGLDTLVEVVCRVVDRNVLRRKRVQSAEADEPVAKSA